MKKIYFLLMMLLFIVGCDKEDPQVTAILLDTTSLELKEGETHQFKVTHTPPEAPTPAYEWGVLTDYSPEIGSSNYYGEVTQSGLFTAKSVGSTSIIVKTTDVVDPQTGLPFSQTCTVNIVPVETESISLDRSEVIMEVGDTVHLYCSIFPENVTYKTVQWKTSDREVVMLSTLQEPLCVLTANGVGEATVKATSRDGKHVVTCKVKVLPAKLEKIALDVLEKSILEGDTFRLKVTFTPSNAGNQNVTWSSSDPKIADVDSDGLVHALDPGECTIKVVSEEGAFEATCKVIVKPTPLESIQFSNTYYNVEIGGTKQLQVTYIPSNARNKNVKWSSSNTTVATVDENGLVKAHTRGFAKITAVSEDGGHNATCTISVVSIEDMMDVSFPSASVVIINGFYNATITCQITNRSSNTVKLTKYRVIDTYTYKTVAETEDESLLGDALRPGESKALTVRLNNVYEPSFIWTLQYNGMEFSTYTRYGDKSGKAVSMSPIVSKGKSVVMSPVQEYK